ncbi:MAG TPA: DUF2254 domain-containing protein [Thiobacillus sp.]
MWLKPAVGSVLAVLFALLAAAGNHLIKPGVLPDIDLETLDSLLGVIASSMLAVSTFSLSIMVAAFASASSAATPRASELVIGDEGTHTAIASFISAFIYSLIAKTALGMGYYGSTGRFLLFISTLGVLTYLIVTLIRWVKTLSSLGRMSNTLAKIEKAAATAMCAHRHAPCLGARTGAQERPEGMHVYASGVGYVQHIDMQLLQKEACIAQVLMHIRERPGSFVNAGTVLLTIEGVWTTETDRLRDAFVIGNTRSFDQDPRFGLIVLSEVAQRALSPAVNDPGTAIAVMNAMTRVLVDVYPESDEAEPPDHDRLTLVSLNEADFVRQGFDPIARDGAGTVEVLIRMQKLLSVIAGRGGDTLARTAKKQGITAMQWAEHGLVLDQHKEAVRQVFESLFEDDQPAKLPVR